MQLHQEVVAPAFDRNAPDGAFHPPYDRLGREHAPGAAARRAGFGHGLEVALPHPLPGHLDQAEVTDGECLRARAIAAEVRAQFL